MTTRDTWDRTLTQLEQLVQAAQQEEAWALAFLDTYAERGMAAVLDALDAREDTHA